MKETAKKNPVVRAVDVAMRRFGYEKVDETSQTGATEGMLSHNFGFALDPETSDRVAVYKEYDDMETDHYAKKAVKVYADNIISSDGEGENVFHVDVIEGVSSLQETVDEVTEQAGIVRNNWNFAKGLVGRGDSFWETIVSGRTKKDILGFRRLPARSIRWNVDKHGRVVDPEKAFIQVGDDFSKKIATFSIWQMLHFNADNFSTNPFFPDSLYGYRESILYKCRAPYQAYSMVKNGALLSRMFNSRRAYKHFVDVGSLTGDEAANFVEKEKQRRTAKQISDYTDGKLDIKKFFENNWVENFFLPMGADEKNNDVSILATGDVPGVDDIKFFRDEYLASLETPKHLLNHTEDVRTRANAGQFSIDFAKNCKRFGLNMSVSLLNFYRFALGLRGIDKTNYKLDIVFPYLGTVNELILWQIQLLKAQVLKFYAIDIGIPVDVVLEHILNVPQDLMDALKDREIIPKTSASTESLESLNVSELRADLLKDPEIMDALSTITELVKI